MDFDEVVQRRKCVRAFNSRKVSFEYALDAIDAANQGPFAGNLNNLRYIIVEDASRIGEISKFSSQHWIANAPALIVVCSNDVHLESQYGERGRVYSRQQAGAAINTIMMKLTEMGLQCCWVGAYSDELVKQLLKIPAHIQIEAIIPFGHEKGHSKKPRKHALENLIRWEAWDCEKRPTIFSTKTSNVLGEMD